MINAESFGKIFNTNFWRPLKGLPINIVPASTEDKSVALSEAFHLLKDREYYPSTPLIHLIKNKGQGVGRVVPVFSVTDYIVYYYCIIQLEPVIAKNRVENTFGGWSISGLEHRKLEAHELMTKESDIHTETIELAELFGFSVPNYSFNPYSWSKNYTDFNARLYENITSKQYRYFAEFDIASFYDSVRLDILERKIRLDMDRVYEDELQLLFHFLQNWNRKENHYSLQSVGIPQDAMNDCSRILANFYLQEYDLFMKTVCEKKGARYFRYCDDQYILSESKDDLEYLLLLASKKLKSIGLNLNQKKVSIGTTEELLVFRSFIIFDLLSEEGAKNDPEKVETFVDELIKILDCGDLTRVKQRGLPLLNKALFCCLEKIEPSKLQRLLREYLSSGYLLEATTDKLSRIYELLSTDADRGDFVQILETLALNSYHNFFHYQVLKLFSDRKLNIAFISNRISDLTKIT